MHGGAEVVRSGGGERGGRDDMIPLKVVEEGPDSTVIPIRGSDRRLRHVAIVELGSGAEAPPAWERRLLIASEGDGATRLTAFNEAIAVVRTPRGLMIHPDGAHNGWRVRGIPLVGPTRIDDGTVLSVKDRAFVVRELSYADCQDLAAEQSAERFGSIATASAALASQHRRLRRLAVSDLPLLLTGETGTGKEVYAQAIHRQSKRAGEMVAINCAAIPADLLESELFGYARGAHSTAAQAKRGLIEIAAGGTLFLDEIGDMPAPLQAKLLRFLQDRQLLPLGTTERRQIDVRIIAATNRSVALRDALIRPDMMARLGPEAIALPPLRARREDIGALAHAFVRSIGGPGWRFTPQAFLCLCRFHWPLNIRELESAIRWAVALADEHVIDVENLPDSVTAFVNGRRGRGRPGRDTRPTMNELHVILGRHRGNVSGAARELDRCTATVWRWLNHFGIDLTRYRRSPKVAGRS